MDLNTFFSSRFFLLNQDPIHGIISSLHTIHQFNFGFEIHVVLTCCSKTCGLEIEKKNEDFKEKYEIQYHSKILHWP